MILTVVGVCVPWRGAHCNGGRKDRKPRQDHRAWLVEFGRLRSTLPATRIVVLGDESARTSQRVPRNRQREARGPAGGRYLHPTHGSDGRAGPA